MGCGELRPPGHRAEQPDPLLTGPRPTRNGAARPSTHRRRIRGDRARQCGVHRKLPRGNGRADEISVGHGYGGRVEQIRQALSPNDGLVAYGASHGSQYGQAYLERYGEHIKALVLDGVVDHSIDLPTFITRNTLAVQDAFERFGQWCNREGACALHGQNVGSVFDAVVTAAPATRMLVPQFLAVGRDPEFGWPTIAKMLAEVPAGNTSKVDELAGTSAAFMNMASDDPFAWRFWDATPVAHGTAGVGDALGGLLRLAIRHTD